MSRAKLDNRKEIELAEGIAVHLHPAGLAPRLLARVMDYSILGIAAWIISLPTIFLNRFLSEEVVMGIFMLVYFFVYWFYDVFFELMKKPATPGKLIMGLRVVKLSGVPTTFGSSFLRALLLPIDIMPAGLVGILSIISTRYSQRVGDLAAGTIVVHSIKEPKETATQISVKPILPQISLTREEQIAFVEFGRRFPKLSQSRQNEIVSCFSNLTRHNINPRDYALGIANHLSKSEEA